MPNNLSEPQEITLLNLFTRHWRLAGAVIFACIGLAALVTLVLPRRYESEMKFLVNNERADLVITPGPNSASAQPPEVSETEVNSEIELLKSRDQLESIVRDHQLYNKPGQKDPNPSNLKIARAVVALERNLNISALRKTNIINVTYSSPDPDLAVAVLGDLGDRYLTAHLAAHSTPGTFNFFSEQVGKYSDQLLRVRAALSVFHREKQLYSLPQQQSSAVEQLETVESQLKNVTAEIHEQETRLAESQAQLATSPERITTLTRSIPNQESAQHLQSLLADLQNKRIELAMKFKPTDRFLIEIDRQIAATQAELSQIQSDKTIEQTTDLDTLHQSLKADYTKGQIALKALETRRTEPAAMRQSYLAQLNGMDQNSNILQNLEQKEKEALENYTLYTHRLDEARLADSLDRQKFSNVAMIEKPVSSPIPVSPKLSLNLAVGALMGIFLSLLLAFYLESKGDQSASAPLIRDEVDLFKPRAYPASASGD